MNQNDRIKEGQKRWLWAAAAGAAVLLLCGVLWLTGGKSSGDGSAAGDSGSEETAEVSPDSTAAPETDASVTENSAGDREETSLPEQTPEPAPSPSSRPAGGQKPPPAPEQAPPSAVEEDGLRFDHFSLYSGQFVEEGRDEPVEQVAAILVTNTTDRFLDLATMAFEIDGKLAAFVATGLPAGRSAWVLELSGLSAPADAKVDFLDCVTSFRDGVQSAPEEISVTASGDLMTVKNRSDKTLEGVCIYYKNRHSDGNYLGGITYTVEAGDLKPGASAEKTAGHYDPETSEIVRISWNDQN